jgi:hypothetical protein
LSPHFGVDIFVAAANSTHPPLVIVYSRPVIEMMLSQLDTATCEGEELVLLLQHHLPTDLAKLWHKTDDILDMLCEGGITSYKDYNQIANLLRAQKRFTLVSNRSYSKRWFSSTIKSTVNTK